jgi:hypothetical protein
MLTRFHEQEQAPQNVLELMARGDASAIGAESSKTVINKPGDLQALLAFKALIDARIADATRASTEQAEAMSIDWEGNASAVLSSAATSMEAQTTATETSSKRARSTSQSAEPSAPIKRAKSESPCAEMIMAVDEAAKDIGAQKESVQGKCDGEANVEIKGVDDTDEELLL